MSFDYYKKFEYEGKVYKVTERVGYLISSFQSPKIKEQAIRIVASQNYQEGKIPEYVLLTALLDYYSGRKFNNWVNLLKSEIYGNGLISYDEAMQLTDMLDLKYWPIIDEKYVNEIVKEEHLKLINEVLNRKYDEHFNVNISIANSVLYILASDAYSEGRISEEIIQLVTTIEDTNKQSVVCAIVRNNTSAENAISEETIKLILKEKIETLIIEMIYCIVNSNIIKPEEKENYILAVLNLQNKEEIHNLYNLYKQKDLVDSTYDFVRNFVLYTLPASQFDIKGSYTRTKSKPE